MPYYANIQPTGRCHQQYGDKMCCLSNFGTQIHQLDLRLEVPYPNICLNPLSPLSLTSRYMIYLDPVRFLEIESIETIESDINNLLIELIWINRIIMIILSFPGFIGHHGFTMDSANTSQAMQRRKLCAIWSQGGSETTVIVEIHWASEHFNMIKEY